MVIVLSSGEAELFVTNKGAAQALGVQSVLEDMGVRQEIRLLTDSNTAKGITKRIGLETIRHLDVNELRAQQQVKDKIITHNKTKNTFNNADLPTKPQDAGTSRSVMELMDHRVEDGRSISAPNLNTITDYNANDLHICCLSGLF